MRSLPTVNDISFELASYHRHLAMALAGGGLLTDFDVINYGFRPGDVALTELCSLETPPTPAVLYGTWEDFEWLIRYFMRFNPLHAVFENRRPHISDMTIVNGLNIPSHSVCRQYHQPGWEVASLVHYTSNSTGGTGGKAERMKADLSRRSFSGGGRMKI